MPSDNEIAAIRGIVMIVQPSKIGAYVSLGHCERFLHFTAAEQPGPGSGNQVDAEGETHAERRGRETETMLTDLLEERHFDKKDCYGPHELIASAMESGRPCYTAQCPARGRFVVGSKTVEVSGLIDVLTAEPDEDAGHIRLTVFECKSSGRVWSAALLQTALYVKLVRDELSDRAQVRANIVVRDADTDQVTDESVFEASLSELDLEVGLADAKSIIGQQIELVEKERPAPHFAERCEFCPYIEPCFKEAITGWLDWAVLGLPPAERDALVQEGAPHAEAVVDSAKVKAAFRRGLRRNKAQLERLYRLRSAYYTSAADGERRRDEVLPRGSGRLPSAGEEPLRKVFLRVVPDAQRRRIAALGVRVLVEPRGEPAQTVLDRSWGGFWDDASERQALITIAQCLEEALTPDTQTGNVCFHAYFWSEDDFTFLVDRLHACAQGQSNDPLLMLAAGLTERDALEGYLGTRLPRVTYLRTYVQQRTNVASIGVSLLEASFLNWPGRADSAWLAEWPVLACCLGVDEADHSLDVDAVRQRLRQHPHFFDRLEPTMVERIQEEEAFRKAFIKIWFDALAAVEAALMKFHSTNTMPAVPVHPTNPVRTPLTDAARPLVEAARQYLEGSQDNVRRAWYAKHFNSIEELISSGTAIELTNPVWANYKRGDERLRLEADVDAEALVALGDVGGTDEIQAAQLKALGKKATQKLSELKLRTDLRAVPVTPNQDILSSEDIVDEGIELTDLKIEELRLGSWAVAKAIPRQSPQANGVPSREHAWRGAEPGTPLFRTDGQEVKRLVVIKDFEPVDPRVRAALAKLADAGFDTTLGALDWWKSDAPPKDVELTDVERHRLETTFKAYAHLREACNNEFLAFRTALERTRDADAVGQSLATLEAAITIVVEGYDPDRSGGSGEPTYEQTAAAAAQRVVIEMLPRRLGLVQGPPGTGKTEFAALAILVWALIQVERTPDDLPAVFVTGVSHQSVSNVLRRCAMVAPLLAGAWRMTSPLTGDREATGRAAAAIRIDRWSIKPDHKLLDAPLAGPEGRLSIVDSRIAAVQGHVQAESYDEQPDAWSEIRARAAIRIVGCVTAQLPNLAADAPIVEKPFRYMVFDEASQTKLQDALLALPLLDHKRGQVLAVGDHRQLGPVEKGVGDADLRYLVRLHRPYGSFYDFVGNHVRPEPLSYTFRLQEDAWRLIASIYQADGVRLHGRSRGHAPHPTSATELLSGTVDWEGVCLLTYDAVRWSGDYKVNPIEIAIIDALFQNGSDAMLDQTVILAPFRVQEDALEAKFGEARVGTVDSMQGAERPTVIYSATGAAAALTRFEDFMIDLRRSNVAMSRSKKRLIVIASKDLLSYTPSTPEAFEVMRIWKHLRRYADRQLEGSPFHVTVSDEDGTARSIAVDALQVRLPNVGEEMSVDSDPLSAPKWARRRRSG